MPTAKIEWETTLFKARQPTLLGKLVRSAIYVGTANYTTATALIQAFRKPANKQHSLQWMLSFSHFQSLSCQLSSSQLLAIIASCQVQMTALTVENNNGVPAAEAEKVAQPCQLHYHPRQARMMVVWLRTLVQVRVLVALVVEEVPVLPAFWQISFRKHPKKDNKSIN